VQPSRRDRGRRASRGDACAARKARGAKGQRRGAPASRWRRIERHVAASAGGADAGQWANESSGATARCATRRVHELRAGSRRLNPAVAAGTARNPTRGSALAANANAHQHSVVALAAKAVHRQTKAGTASGNPGRMRIASSKSPVHVRGRAPATCTTGATPPHDGRVGDGAGEPGARRGVQSHERPQGRARREPLRRARPGPRRGPESLAWSCQATAKAGAVQGPARAQARGYQRHGSIKAQSPHE